MIEAVGYGILVPLGVAAGVTWFLQRLLHDRTRARYLSVIGLACGFLAGYALAIDGPWVPERNWHWLPYLAVAAALAGAIALVRPPSKQGRRAGALAAIVVPALFLVLAIAASVILVPTWTNRLIQVPGFATLIFLQLLLFDRLPKQVSAHHLLPLLYLCVFTTAAFVAARISLIYGQLAGLAGASFLGSSLVLWIQGDGERIRGLLPAYVVLLEGAAYVGCIYPNDPIYALLIPPAAPLVLWVFCCGPVSRLQGGRRTVVEYGIVLALLAGTAAVLFAGSFGESGTEW
jgi:hypothetical protein